MRLTLLRFSHLEFYILNIQRFNKLVCLRILVVIQSLGRERDRKREMHREIEIYIYILCQSNQLQSNCIGLCEYIECRKAEAPCCINISVHHHHSHVTWPAVEWMPLETLKHPGPTGICSLYTVRLYS